MLRIFFLVLLFVNLPLRAQDLDSGIAKLSNDLAAGISKSGSKKISVIDFTDLQGRESAFGRFIAEQLSVSLVNSAKDFAVMDRANLKSILDEHKLTASGLVNPENARKLGQFAGVDAIVLGSITPFGETLFVTAKAISTETTQVLAASKVTIARTKDIDALLGVGATVQPNDTTTDEVGDSAPPPKPPEKDFSAQNSTNVFEQLSVELMSFRFVQSGGLLITLKLKNLSATNPIRVGLNVSANGTSGTFVTDDQGNMFEAIGAGGPGAMHPSGSNSAFEAMLDWQQRLNFPTIPEAFQGNLNKMILIEPRRETVAAIRFNVRTGSVGGQFRLQSEMIVAEMFGRTKCNLTLENLLIDGINPR